MDTRPMAPDPQHDRHVAFPDGAGTGQATPPRSSSLPPSAWAPARDLRRLPPPSTPRLPPPGTSAGWPGRRARHAGGWLVGALFAVAVLGDVAFSLGPEPMNDTHVEWGLAEPWGDGSPAVPPPVTTVSPGSDIAGVQSADLPTHQPPSGTTTYRVEVVGSEPAATLHLIGGHGDAAIPESILPLVIDVSTHEPDSLEFVQVLGVHLQDEIQCRIYVGEELVAIATGPGQAECALPPSRPETS